MDYWKECISIALDECGIVATEEQINDIAKAVEGGAENYSTAHGYDCIPDPVESRAQEELRRLKQEKEQRERFESLTKPCRTCTTSGWVRDGWGRDQVCTSCDGKGRV